MTRDISNRYFKGSTIVVESEGAVRTTDSKKAIRWAANSGDSTIIYVAAADVGSADASAVWSIAEIDTTNGTIKHADFSQYTQIWDNREALSYT